jgi:DNA mismatch repair protein MutS
VQPVALQALRPPRIERAGDAMVLDEMTRRNLELIEPLRADARARQGGHADRGDRRDADADGCAAAAPLAAASAVVADRIRERHDAVANCSRIRDAPRLRAELKDVRDLERLAGGSAPGAPLPRELRALAQSLGTAAGVRAALEVPRQLLLCGLAEGIDVLDDVATARACAERRAARDASARAT